jgi:hypothetical protein
MTGCKTCGITLGRTNKSGYCRNHFNPSLTDPEWRVKQKAGMKRMLSDPAKLEALKERARIIGKTPGATEARRAAAKRIGLYKIGHKALEGNQDARRRAGAHRTATALKDIPSELRAEYRELTHVKRIPAAEARQMVLEKHELEMARWRREAEQAHAAANERHLRERVG